MTQGTVNLIMGISYIIVIGSFIVFASWMTIQRRKNAEAMKRNIESKLGSEINLCSRDIVNIGKSFDLTPFQSRKIVYKIFSGANNPEAFSKLKQLVNEIETEEPFDDLPDEVKPSLVRITKISEETKEESDKYILSPIIQTLNKFVELKSEQEKLKKQTTRAYFISVISVVIGAVSFYFTLTSPSAEEIVSEINSTNPAQKYKVNQRTNK
ncbi:MAG: hypothetical protein KBT53_04330 [Porticoccus sp.]|nr:hypothetical protein [Porticoccus sp.]